MARATNAAAAARRATVAGLWAQGASTSAIAARVGSTWRTVRDDVALVARQALEELDVPRELARLLLAGKAVEATCWELGLPMRALAAQRQQLAVLGQMQSLEVEARLRAIEERLDALQGVQPWMAPRVRAAAENGTGRG